MAFEIINNQLFYDFAATPNTDVSVALQAALNTFKRVNVDGEYIISTPINLTTGMILTGNGKLKKSGDRIINMNSNDAILENLSFSLIGSSINANYGSCIVRIEGFRNNIDNCRFDYKLDHEVVSAVWITGPKAMNNLVQNCNINGLGLTVESSSSYNAFKKNIIKDSIGNGISVTGNDAIPAKGNKVLDNILLNSGRMGIEDWDNTQKSEISNNHIDQTGVKDPGEGLGISAVGYDTTVSNNTVKNYRHMGIELSGNRGLVCTGNYVYDGAGTTSGIMGNFQSSGPEQFSSLKIFNNNIFGCRWGIDVYGTVSPRVQINDNNIFDIRQIGIRVEAPGDNLQINGDNNKLFFSSNRTQQRYGIRVSGGSGKSNQKILFTGTQFLYSKGLPQEIHVESNVANTSIS